MDLICIRLFLLSAFWVSVDAVFKTCALEIAFRGKAIASKSIWQRSSVWDQLACAVACMTDLSCWTFSYSSSKKKCLGYPGVLKSYMDNVTDSKDDDMITVGPCTGNIGTMCRRSDQCNFKGSICFRGTCLCTPGLYFSPQHNSCFRHCTEYGPGMDHYKRLSVKGHNKKVFDNVIKTAADCQNRCEELKSFACLTTDWYHGKYSTQCLLSDYGYLDVPASNRQQNEEEWTLFQRRCK